MAGKRMKGLAVVGLGGIGLLALPAWARDEEAVTVATTAAPAPAINGADTAFVLISAALVMLMTPGLGLFYGGMTRRKNVLGTIMQSFVALGIITIQWALFGYSLSFGPDIGHFIGSLKFFALNGVGVEPNADYAATIPH